MSISRSDKTPQAPAFLGVDASVSGKKWVARALDERIALGLAQRHNLPEVAGRVLAARGVGFEEAEAFLNPALKTLLPDPSLLKDMDQAAARLADAVMGEEIIAVFGDYDVDGATSSALLNRFLTGCGAEILVHIPDRMKEGYGPNAAALRRFKQQGAGVAVMVDCGITAFAALQAAQADELDVIVVDHHAAEPQLPPAIAVVNPNRLDEAGGLGHLAAVGVSFLVAVAVNRELRRRGYFTKARPAPDLLGLLDLVALGTVCDVVALTGLNRAYVAQGLKVMAQRRNAGLCALADVAGMSEQPETYHLGFLLGPRINAGGRVGEASLGTRLLSCDLPEQAAEIARQLDRFNAERKLLEEQSLEAALTQMEAKGEICSMAFAVGEDWHPGVIGIVAGRLKERYNRPGLVMTLQDGLYKGSGRSIPGLDLGAAVIAARQAGLLEAGGGHPMAAGFSVLPERLADFETFLARRFEKQIAADALVPTLSFDGILHVGGATLSLINALEKIGPFGPGNPKPRFVINECRIVDSRVVGSDHVSCTLTDLHKTSRLRAIAFRSLETDLGQALLHHRGKTLKLAGSLKRNSWQGRDSAQLIIEDLAG